MVRKTSKAAGKPRPKRPLIRLGEIKTGRVVNRLRELHELGSAQVDDPFVRELHGLKVRTGLSLSALAARTPYSKSAWHRYLRGVQRPPRSAVEELARLAGVDPAPVLVRWQEADHALVPGAPPGGAPVARPARSRLLLSAFALVVTAAAVAVIPFLANRSGDPGERPAVGFSPGGPGERPAVGSSCRGRACEGQLPDLSDCDRDAQTKAHVHADSYVVRLEYSPSCGTAWAELQARSSAARVISVRSGSNVLSVTYPGDGSGGWASPMLAVASPQGVEACAKVDSRLACTGLGA
ncbi:helix-turn-helix domain-containing protein [Streptomyces sp. HUAS TT20]|uniref:helix-turn-helix domain-containing protein n=1 Tax=Streptomyces sp. HUAS TT20 TaxID=3447509 RepID=UPI0021D7D37E|nr:XRE family transcriptional regulator [Streptomyces sp. HUAS 15-9]UXY30231.1 XRE family transcriptional regulator [Streptomyces sp. HUAS 15-9]